MLKIDDRTFCFSNATPTKRRATTGVVDVGQNKATRWDDCFEKIAFICLSAGIGVQVFYSVKRSIFCCRPRWTQTTTSCKRVSCSDAEFSIKIWKRDWERETTAFYLIAFILQSRANSKADEKQEYKFSFNLFSSLKTILQNNDLRFSISIKTVRIVKVTRFLTVCSLFKIKQHVF